MNTCWKSLHHIASALLVSLVLTGCASGPKPPPPDLQQQIETARTRVDHQSLAAYYEREAAGAGASAAEHRKTAKACGSPPIGRGGLNTQEHCAAIASKYEGIATDYEGLVAHHRLMADRAQP